MFGGTSEIGAETAVELVRRGTRKVVLAGRDLAALAPIEERLRAEGAENVELVVFDAVEVTKHERMVNEAFSKGGDIDLVLVAFGTLGDQEEAERQPALAVHIIETNFVGAASVALRVASRLRDQGHGQIVVLSSVAAERARRANFVYGSSKAGVDAFFQGLADTLTDANVGVMVVRPGFVHTKMTAGREPAPFATTPEAVALAICKGLDRGAHTVWVPAILRPVMMVIRHLPRPLFRRISREG